MRRREVLALYRGAPLWVRFHTHVRWATCPFEKIAGWVPRKGRILDIGCGYGLMANLLALESPVRDIVGTDVSREKIDEAARTIGSRTNIRFEHGGIRHVMFPERTFQCILILDVLYLLPLDQWTTVVTQCFRSLDRGGLLLVKEQGRRPVWKYLWNFCQEFLSVRVFRLTEGSALTFPGREYVAALLTAAGFAVDAVPLDRGSIHPHILFVCRRP